MKKYPDLIDELLNFLDAPAMNHLLVTFPIKVIANFLNQEPEEVGDPLTLPIGRVLCGQVASFSFSSSRCWRRATF
jgi:hypothetical protein